MEEKEEAGYRSPTWKILRALQKVNNATQIEGEAIMSAPPSFRVSRPRRPGVLGHSRRADGDYLGKLVGIGENKLVEK